MDSGENLMAHVIVVGCGNIGSQLIPHLGRLPSVDRITLIDPEDYERKNMEGQAIDSCDVGKPKACVQAAHLKRINPNLQVSALIASVENLPLGILRSDLIFGCLDSRLARMNLNQFAWRLGTTYIDAGVDPDGMLVRVDVYRPGDDQPCLECSWTDRDYEGLEYSYPCLRGRTSRSTNSTSGLGALAASIQVIEAQKILAGHANPSHQVLMDAMHNKYYSASLQRNSKCRFDHTTWRIDSLHLALSKWTLRDVLHLAMTPGSEAGVFSLGVEGMPFVRTLVCPGCGHSKSVLRLKCSLSVKDSICGFCRQQLLPSGWQLTEELTSYLPARTLSRSLKSLGLRNGEVITIGSGLNNLHFQIAADEEIARGSSSDIHSGPDASRGCDVRQVTAGEVQNNV
jgi:molybdopterin/thiamine biosynthesis adenylyltransferase